MKLALDETLPRIKGNPGKLQQVFLNLFLNARDAMESGGMLSVSTTHHENASDRQVRVSVPIRAPASPRRTSQIFDPFFTTKAAERDRPRALGQLRDREGARRRN